MKYSILLLAFLTIVGCSREAESSKNVGAFKVEKLFDYEGCTAYRFVDTAPVYYVRCESSSSVQTDHQCGKVRCKTNIASESK